MTPQTFVILSSVLSFGLPLAFAVRELLTLSVGPPRRDDPPPEDRLPDWPRPLPECLLPMPVPDERSRDVRVLEMV